MIKYIDSISEKNIDEYGWISFEDLVKFLTTQKLDLKKIKTNYYEVKDREPMYLYSKDKITSLIKKIGFKKIKKIDEHVTDVGSGKRNVFTFIAQK